jgi:hypothetical protein
MVGLVMDRGGLGGGWRAGGWVAGHQAGSACTRDMHLRLALMPMSSTAGHVRCPVELQVCAAAVKRLGCLPSPPQGRRGLTQ